MVSRDGHTGGIVNDNPKHNHRPVDLPAYRELKALAKEQGVPVPSLTREAMWTYVALNKLITRMVTGVEK
jgi:hypothetical protein